VYDLLRIGKENFARKNYRAARDPFAQAAEMGNTEAMVFLAKLYWDGLGGASDRARGLELERGAAEKGDTLAMKMLAGLYEAPGALQDLAEAKRWRAAAAEAEKLKQSLALIDPTGRADRGEPRIPARDVAILPPPTNLRVQ
jgi:TPR repeat protein